MAAEAREIREHFARARAYYQRRDVLRSLASVIAGLKGMVAGGVTGVGLIEAQGVLREVLQMLGRDETVQPLVLAADPQGLVYQRGGERALLVTLVGVLRTLHEAQGAESHEETLARKQYIDAALSQGSKHLEQGRPSEADACFADAVTRYRDEHRMFQFIGRMLLDAGEVRRAIPYLKRGVAADPEDAAMAALLAEGMRRRDG